MVRKFPVCSCEGARYESGKGTGRPASKVGERPAQGGRPQLLEYTPGTPENAREILLERYWELTQRAEALPDY